MVTRWDIRDPPVPDPLNYRNTGWKIDAITDKWVGRLLEPSDAGRKKYSDNGPEDLLRLDTPVTGRSMDHMLEWGPIVDRWGLQILNAAGFINGHVPPEHEDDEYDEDETFIPEGKFHEKHQDFNDFLHPVLRRDMWCGILHHDWDLIQPSVQLASALLDEPDLLRFFQAYFKGWSDQYLPARGKFVKFVDLPGVLSDQEYEQIYFKFAQMRNHVDFSFVDDTVLSSGTVGATASLRETNGMRPGTTCKSHIFFPNMWLQVFAAHRDYPIDAMSQGLTTYQRDDRIPPDRRIKIDSPSARLRTTLMFTATILHELAHAVVNACIDEGDPEGEEPFFPNNDSAEAGFSLEKHVFHGEVMTWGTEMERELAAPYGTRLQLNPAYRNQLLKPQGRSTTYPVPTQWTSAFFDRRFWEEVVWRYGAREFQCPVAMHWAASMSVP